MKSDLHLVPRPLWLRQIEANWKRRPVVWLSGVRRVGKTSLCHTIPDTQYFDCELPSVRREMEDPEAFLKGLSRSRIVLDEIHRLNNPTELLKIAADHFPSLRILATGSSSMEASAKFQDKLTGRKIDLRLPPVLLSELAQFGIKNIDTRMLRGGLPPFLLADERREQDYQEWLDSFWAKDIQELFRLERRRSFLKFIELLLVQSGGIFEATSFAHPCEVSRTTIVNYLNVLESCLVAYVVRPFSSRKSAELVAAPKVYAFDTGFYCFYRGWEALRSDDRGVLWEHLVLNELGGRLQSQHIQYWRNKRGHEVDFVWVPHGKDPIAIECKWNSRSFDPSNVASFRGHYPVGKNYVVCGDVERTVDRHFGKINVTLISLEKLVEQLV